VKIDQLRGNRGSMLVAKETGLLRAKRHHPFGLNLNLVLFIPPRKSLFTHGKKFMGKKKEIYFYPKG